MIMFNTYKVRDMIDTIIDVCRMVSGVSIAVILASIAVICCSIAYTVVKPEKKD